MLKAARRFAGAIEKNEAPRWLTFTGKSGTGKTHLARKLYEHWKQTRGTRNTKPTPGGLIYTCDFVVWPAFSEKLRDRQYHKVQELIDVEFAVIDELGTDYDPSNYALSKLDRILNERLGKWTVITSNFSRAQIAEKMDVRISSRLTRGGGELIELTQTKDFCLRK